MAEESRGLFPAAEIWGLNRRRPCLLALTSRRLLVLPRERGGRPRRRNPGPLAALEAEASYALPLEDIRWVQVTPSLLAFLVKLQTPGGSYRFRLSRRRGPGLERRLRELLGAKVRRPGQFASG